MSIRVFIVEDHPVMRETLTEYLALRPDLELCGAAANAEEALLALHDAAASLVLLDLSLPGRNGIDLLKDIGEQFQLPCIVLSGHREPGYVQRALDAGGRGYILKGRPKEIPIAILAVMKGEIYLSESLRGIADESESEAGP